MLVYTFKVIAISCIIYLILIPISFFHFRKISKEKNLNTTKDESDDLEDIL